MDRENSKVWRSSKDAPSGMQVTDEFAAVIGDKQHFLLSNRQGTVIHGPFSVVADARNRRLGGLWTNIDDFLHMFPSTIVSPIPQQIPNPILGVLFRLQQDTAFFAGALGGF